MIVAHTLCAKTVQDQDVNVQIDQTGALTSTPGNVSTSPRTAFLAMVGCIFFYSECLNQIFKKISYDSYV